MDSVPRSLLQPDQCTLLLVDFQAGLAFGVESSARQTVLHNAIALARTAVTFSVPVVVSTSASKIYSGPLFPSLQAVLPDVKTIERRNMNVWEDETARSSPRVESACSLPDCSQKPAYLFQHCLPLKTASKSSSLPMPAAV
jgi:hypothetical protein